MTRRVATLLALGLLVAACGGGGGSGGDGGGDAASGCPVDALDETPTDATEPVEITFWHTMAAENEAILQRQTERFNASQDRVRVTLAYQGSYDESFQKYRAALSGGEQPQLIQLEETVVQQVVDSESTVPIGECVTADDYDLEDYLPRAIEYYTTEDVLRAMPWTVSNPILFYNRSAFDRAGLDPNDPPSTLEEVRAYSEQIVASGAATAGISLRVEPFYNEFFYAKAGQIYVNNGNGRDERATAADLDNDAGLEIWTWWKDMVDSGLAINTGSQPGNTDHLFAIGNGNSAMTIEASGAIGPVLAVLGSGQFPDVDPGVGPLPSLQEGGGVPVGDGALWIPASASPEEQAAAWEFTQFLTAPEQQAELHVDGGYVPIRRSAVDLPQVQDLWAREPLFRVAYDQLEGGPVDDATVGSVIGDYQGVRNAVRDGLTAMLEGLTPAEALAQAQREADAAIADYNDRVAP